MGLVQQCRRKSDVDGTRLTVLLQSLFDAAPNVRRLDVYVNLNRWPPAPIVLAKVLLPPLTQLQYLGLVGFALTEDTVDLSRFASTTLSAVFFYPPIHPRRTLCSCGLRLPRVRRTSLGWQKQRLDLF